MVFSLLSGDMERAFQRFGRWRRESGRKGFGQGFLQRLATQQHRFDRFGRVDRLGNGHTREIRNAHVIWRLGRYIRLLKNAANFCWMFGFGPFPAFYSFFVTLKSQIKNSWQETNYLSRKSIHNLLIVFSQSMIRIGQTFDFFQCFQKCIFKNSNVNQNLSFNSTTCGI